MGDYWNYEVKKVGFIGNAVSFKIDNLMEEDKVISTKIVVNPRSKNPLIFRLKRGLFSFKPQEMKLMPFWFKH